MGKEFMTTIDDMVERIQTNSCRITIPYSEPSPLTVVFDGDFTGAGFIRSYPGVIYIFGIPGHVAILLEQIISIKEVKKNVFVITFTNDSHKMDMMVKILE